VPNTLAVKATAKNLLNISFLLRNPIHSVNAIT
jgi:hypothetical protein